MGKTLTAKLLVGWLCRNEQALLDLDLRRFTRRYHREANELDALIGVRPPYVGWERGGVLTNHVMQFPRSLIIVRGIEEASTEVCQLFESIFSQGFCTDGRGQQVAFTETFFIFMCDWMVEDQRRIGFRERTSQADLSSPREALESAHFPKSILDHVQTIIPFAPLSRDAVRKILTQKMEDIKVQLHHKEGKVLEWDSNFAESYLVSDHRREGDSLSEMLEHLERSVRATLIQLKTQPHWAEWRVIRLKISQENIHAQAITPCLLVVDDVPDFFNELRTTYPEYD